MLGHASANMTLNTHADLFEDDLDAVMASMSVKRAEACALFAIRRDWRNRNFRTNTRQNEAWTLCGRRDLNPHARRHQNLNLACLPISPLPQQ